MYLVAAFDVGKTHSGFALGKINQSNVQMLYIDCHITPAYPSKKGISKHCCTELMSYLDGTVKNLIAENCEGCQVIVVYENCLYYRNFILQEQNKTLHNYFKDLGYQVFPLQPKQKEGGTISKNDSEKLVSNWLRLNQGGYLSTFTNFTRRHDVADAIRMILFLANNENCIAELARKPTKSFSNKALFAKRTRNKK